METAESVKVDNISGFKKSVIIKIIAILELICSVISIVCHFYILPPLFYALLRPLMNFAFLFSIQPFVPIILLAITPIVLLTKNKKVYNFLSIIMVLGFTFHLIYYFNWNYRLYNWNYRIFLY